MSAYERGKRAGQGRSSFLDEVRGKPRGADKAAFHAGYVDGQREAAKSKASYSSGGGAQVDPDKDPLLRFEEFVFTRIFSLMKYALPIFFLLGAIDGFSEGGIGGAILYAILWPIIFGITCYLIFIAINGFLLYLPVIVIGGIVLAIVFAIGGLWGVGS